MIEYNFGFVKDGGELLEGVSLTTYQTADEESKMMGSILGKNNKGGNEDLPTYLKRMEVKADGVRPGWVKNNLRRRLARQGASALRPFPLL